MGGNGTGAEERREEGGLGNKSEKVFNISFISLKAANLKTQTAAGWQGWVNAQAN